MSTCLMTHYDLDAVTCAILIKHAYDISEMKCQGYGKVSRNLQQLIDSGKHDTIIFTDLMVAEEDMLLALKNFDKVIFFDHHEDSARYVEWAERYDNLEVHFTLTMSASAIVYMHAVDNGLISAGSPTGRKLAALTMYTNIFDMWQITSDKWQFAYDLNTLFWEGNFWQFESRWKNGFDGLTSDENRLCRNVHAARKTIVENAPKIELDTINGENRAVIIAFENKDGVADCTLMLDYDRFYIIYYVEGEQRLSVRARGESADADCVNVNSILSALAENRSDLIDSAGGHKLAGGITLKKSIHINDAIALFRDELNPLFDEMELPF